MERVVASASGCSTRSRVDLVPVVMGGGRRFFGGLAIGDAPLGDPTVCVQGDRVTHLVFPAMRSGDPTQR